MELPSLVISLLLVMARVVVNYTTRMFWILSSSLVFLWHKNTVILLSVCSVPQLRGSRVICKAEGSSGPMEFTGIDGEGVSLFPLFICIKTLAYAIVLPFG